jgi:hypothetical protein
VERYSSLRIHGVRCIQRTDEAFDAPRRSGVGFACAATDTVVGVPDGFPTGAVRQERLVAQGDDPVLSATTSDLLPRESLLVQTELEVRTAPPSDACFALRRAVQCRGWENHPLSDLLQRDANVCEHACTLEVGRNGVSRPRTSLLPFAEMHCDTPRD